MVPLQICRKKNMNYLAITKDDMLNGDGLRVVLWVAGCYHHCKGCQNSYSWNFEEGKPFNYIPQQEIYKQLEKDYISGITFSGGDPLAYPNHREVMYLCREIKRRFPDKTIWIYTGYKWEFVRQFIFMDCADVLVDGQYIEEQRNVNTPWTGSDNQRVIDVQRSLNEGKVILYETRE